ncbi:MAG: alpha-glucosidase C-terminal domain-containing protein, partial [Anaerolineae bacterium]|nr:alpha-glucosidase C-terminal domain-containing protein [Anaerolineae bacterium]
DPRLGTLGDFVDFTHRAQLLGLRVIVDLVINHTSIDHPWFQEARKNKDSKYHDYYVWSDEKPDNADEGVIFPGVQESTWTYDEEAGQYYFHRFYKHQPDLNIANPDVQEEMRKIMGFWLEMGVEGFRIDAAPFVVEMKHLKQVSEDDTKENYLEFFRRFLQWRRRDAIMVAEANVAKENISLYFGDGDRMHMLFNFIVNQKLFASLAFETAEPLYEGYAEVPRAPAQAQWAQFLRNHDELSLDKLDEDTRQKVFEKFAPKESMRIYNRGIRRRLAPILGNDRRRIELANSLLLTLPGTPIIRYGQEIGMGDDLSLRERNSVRTPMQWSDEKNGGFSSANPKDLIRPVINEGEYGYKQVNVAQQRLTKDSLLKWMQDAIRMRLQCPEIGAGKFEVIQTEEPAVFAHRCSNEEGSVLVLHNFSAESVTVTIPVSDDTAYFIELFNSEDDGQTQIECKGTCELTLGAYGYRWLREKAEALVR